MRPQAYKTKIFASVVGFLILISILFGYGFPWLKAREQARLLGVLEQKKTVAELRQQQRNIELARQDLKELSTKTYGPDEFFPKDTTLVGQLRSLEAKAKEFKVELAFSVSGTVATAPKAKTASELYMVPFTAQLKGGYAETIAYLDWLEHLPTILSVRSLGVSSASETEVSTSLVGSLHLRK